MTNLRAYQPSFTAGELSPALWARTDLAKYASGLKVTKNLFIHPHGGASNRPGLRFCGEVKHSEKPTRLIPFQFNTVQTYVLEFGDLYMRVWKNGEIVLSESSPYEIKTPYSSDQVFDLVITQEADVMYITHVRHAPQKLGRLADDNWIFITPTFMPSMAAPEAPTVSSRAAGTKTYLYRISAISATTGEESLPSPIGGTTAAADLGVANEWNDISWTAVPGAQRYIVYKLDNGVYGYIGGTEGTTFRDENITADLADTPQTGYNPFIGEGNYPRCSTFVDQRLAFASSLNNPQACWLSQSANYENFGYSRPRKASDGFEFRIRARQVNEIRSLLQVRSLMILTSGGEYAVTGGQDEYLTPDTIVVKNQGYRGAATVQPIVVGNVILFAQERGGVIRDFSYEFAQDSFVGKDLTILARHLFDDRSIKSWAYAQAPYSIVWVVLDDGSLVSLTYIKEHEVWAWTRHETDGVFEDVTVVAEGLEDVPYFIVRRKIGGVDRRYVERMQTRLFEKVEDAFFVDSGLTYSGTPATLLSGLSHLNEKTVVAMADGNVVRNLTVSNGSVTLPFAASKVHVGLPYEATLMTLDLDTGMVQGLGTVQGRKKTVAEVTLRVEKTRGIWIGTADETRDSGKLIEFKQRSSEAWDEAIGLMTGDLEITPIADWTNGGNIVIKQFDPLPMTILAIMPDVAVGL
ncbi:MAG: hypothetical protein IT544_00500 [Rhodobacteraceae bacterium]|nr:hypothetical protein [Paracoccaceae bacterium]